MPHYESIAPIVRVEDMKAALRFYLDVMGFTRAPWSTDDFGCVSSGNSSIYLSRGAQGRGGTWVWIGTDDVRALHDALRAKGVKILLEPTKFPWALEIQVEDPDGNVLRIGSDPE
jgi:predicted enzyme related to lactoylglutathione lyase